MIQGKRNQPRFQLQKSVWNIILMKLQMELFTDLYGVFAVLTNGRIHQKNRNCFI